MVDKLVDYAIKQIQKIRSMDRAAWEHELREIAFHVKKQLFSQIPGVSAIAGILVGSWVANTFTSSPIKGFLSSVGLMKGGTHVVSGTTYKFLSVVLPLLAVAGTAYLVQKGMKAFRERQLERNKIYVALMKEEAQTELQDKMDLLARARDAGLISDSEYDTKLANLYQSYVRSDRSKFEEILIKKIEG